MTTGLGSSSHLPKRLQELPPKAATFCLAVRRFMADELRQDLRGKHVLIGFSGGADSTALLLSLFFLSPSLGCSLSACHLDHRLRPSSGKEAEACQAFCDGLGIPCTTEECSVPDLMVTQQCGLEEAARNARYEFYSGEAGRTGAHWTAVGHNADDLAEDILMRLVRGAGWPGLGGMRGVDAERSIFRPLLLTPRKKIEQFLDLLEVGRHTDESNADLRYTRNRVRHTLLPMVLRENPNFLETAGRLWRIGQMDADWLGGQLSDILAVSGKTPPCGSGSGEETASLFLSREQLLPLHSALRLRLYKNRLDALGSGQVRLDTLLRLDRAWEKATITGYSGKTIHEFAGDKRAGVTCKGIRFYKQS